MATFYARSTDGSDADGGTTWPLAKATLTGATNVLSTPSDTIYVSQSHAESSASSLAWSWFNTVATGVVRVICGNDSAEPPTALATTATFTTTGTTNIQWASGSTCTYAYGFSFFVGTGSGTGSFTATAAATGMNVFESCNFRIVNTSTGSLITITNNTEVINCGFRFANNSQRINADMSTKIKGGSIISGGTSPTAVFNTSPGICEGFDFSNCSAGVHLVSGTTPSGVSKFRHCKLPTSWSGAPHSGTPGFSQVIELINCTAGAVTYAYWRAGYTGTLKYETVVVKSGGASDGTTAVSWKMVSNANIFYPTVVLYSNEMMVRNAATGSSVIATVEIVTDNVTLKDDECWLELFYMAGSGNAVVTRLTDFKAGYVATGANQDSSSVTWTTTGLTTPVKQKLVVTFTPQLAGFVYGRVVLAKASTTVYIDPKITLT